MLFETKSALGSRADIRVTPPRTAPRASWARLLGEIMALTQGNGELLHHAERRWASATFSGARHSFALTFNGAEAIEAGERLIAELADHEFDIPGKLVADAAVTATDQVLLPEPALTVELDVLLLEDL